MVFSGTNSFWTGFFIVVNIYDLLQKVAKFIYIFKSTITRQS